MVETAVAQTVVRADKAQVVVENRLGYGRHVALLVRLVPDGDNLIGKTIVGELTARGTRALDP
jgi:hypothetical protein